MHMAIKLSGVVRARSMYLVGSGAYQQNEGDLLDTVSSNLIDLRLQIGARFPSDRGQERVLVRDVGSVCSARR